MAYVLDVSIPTMSLVDASVRQEKILRSRSIFFMKYIGRNDEAIVTFLFGLL